MFKVLSKQNCNLDEKKLKYKSVFIIYILHFGGVLCWYFRYSSNEPYDLSLLMSDDLR